MQEGGDIRIKPEELEPPCMAPIDLVFVLDNTGSMGGAIENIKLELDNLISLAETASGGGLRMGYITFSDQVDVKNQLTTDIDAVRANIMAETGTGGGNNPEASDEAKNTTVNNLETRVGQPLPFTEPYRNTALKIVILITDAPAGGFNDVNDPADDQRMHDVAADSATLGILVSDIFVPTSGDSGQAAILEDDAATSGGLFATVNADGTGTSDAVSDIIQGCGTE